MTVSPAKILKTDKLFVSKLSWKFGIGPGQVLFMEDFSVRDFPQSPSRSEQSQGEKPLVFFIF